MGLMDQTRFGDLAEAYGGRIELWPLAEREAAWRFLADQGETARALLGDATGLDELLQVLRPPQPSAALRQAILDAAPKARAAPSRLWRWLAGAGLGAGLAAACAAGIVTGAISGAPVDRAGVEEARADALIAGAADDGIDVESNS